MRVVILAVIVLFMTRDVLAIDGPPSAITANSDPSQTISEYWARTKASLQAAMRYVIGPDILPYESEPGVGHSIGKTINDIPGAPQKSEKGQSIGELLARAKRAVVGPDVLPYQSKSVELRPSMGKTADDIPRNLGINKPYLSPLILRSKSDNKMVEVLNLSKDGYIKRPKQLEVERIEANRQFVASLQGTTKRTAQPALIPGPFFDQSKVEANTARINEAAKEAVAKSRANTPFARFINSLFGEEKNFSSGKIDKITFNGDMIYLSRGNTEKIPIQLKQSDGSPLLGRIVGYSKNYIYIQDNSGSLIQWDLRDDNLITQNVIPLGGTIAGFKVWGDHLFIVVEGVGFVSMNERNGSPTVQSLGENRFLHNGVRFFSSGLIVSEENLTYKFDFLTGETRVYATAEFLPAQGTFEEICGKPMSALSSKGLTN